MRVLFLGHQAIGQRCLSALLEDGADVRLIVGHEGEESLSSLAHTNNIPFQLATKTPEAWHWEGSGPDWIVSVYFRYLIPESMLTAPKGAMNIHCSLLPAYRGCAPVNWAILNGETRVGVTLHDMVSVADAGDIIEQSPYDINPHQNAGDVMDHLSEMAASMLKRQLPLVRENLIQRTPQPIGDFPIYRRRTPKDGLIDWSWPAERIHNLIRAVNPANRYGGAQTPEGQLVISSQRVKDTHIPMGYTRVACGQDMSEKLDIQLFSA